MASITNNNPNNNNNYEPSTESSLTPEDLQRIGAAFFKSVNIYLRPHLKLPMGTGSVDKLGPRVFILRNGYKNNPADDEEHPTYVPKHEKAPPGMTKVCESCEIEIVNTVALKTLGKRGDFFFASRSDDPAYPHFRTCDSRLIPKNL